MEPRLENRKGSFYVAWYDSEKRHTRRQSLRTKDEAQAKKRFALWLVADETDDSGHVSVDIVCDYYIQHHVLVHVEDKARTQTALAHVLEHFGGMQCNNVDPQDVQNYVSKRTQGIIGHPSKAPTIRRELGSLVAALRFAVRHRMLKRDDEPYIPLPAKSEPKDRVLTDDEETTLLLSAQTIRCQRFIVLALETGSRKTAIETLTWDRVDLERGIIDLHDQRKRRTKKRAPKVPISNALMSHLRGWRAKSTDSFVIGSSGSIKRSFGTACRRAGLTDVTPHTLRHTWASKAARAGISLWDIAAVLGNSFQVVQDTYAHHSPDFLRDAVNWRESGAKLAQ